MQENLFSQRLKAKMKEHSLRQIDILRAAESRGIKLGKSHVSQYVSGKTVPRDNIISFLAEILETDVKWLRGTEFSTEAQTSVSADDISDNYSGGTQMREFKKLFLQG